jgi:hypothetical protein
LGAAKRAKPVFRFSDDLFVFMGWQGRLKRLSVSSMPFTPHQIDSLPLLRPAFCEPLFGIGLSVIPPHPIVD